MTTIFGNFLHDLQPHFFDFYVREQHAIGNSTTRSWYLSTSLVRLESSGCAQLACDELCAELCIISSLSCANGQWMCSAAWHNTPRPSVANKYNLHTELTGQPLWPHRCGHDFDDLLTSRSYQLTTVCKCTRVVNMMKFRNEMSNVTGHHWGPKHKRTCLPAHGAP